MCRDCASKNPDDVWKNLSLNHYATLTCPLLTQPPLSPPSSVRQWYNLYSQWERKRRKNRKKTGVWTLLTPGTLSVPFYLILFLLNPSISQPEVIFLWQSILFRCSQTLADRVGEEESRKSEWRVGGWVGCELETLEPDTVLQSFHLGLVIPHWVNKWQVSPVCGM